MTHDDRERDAIRRALDGYRTPPRMPDGEIWAAIDDELARPNPAVIPLSPWMRIRPRLGTALAASLVAFVAGTGVGYGVARRDDDPPAADRQADAGPPETPVLYRVTWF